MMKPLNEELVEIKEKLRLKKKWEDHLQYVSAALEKEKDKQQRLEKELAKEQKDVDKLEGLSIAGILYALIGKKLEKMDKERQDVIAIQLKLEEATQVINDLIKEQQELEQQLAMVATADEEYEQLLKRKESLIHAKNKPLSEKLYALFEQEADLQATVKEVEEALTAGKKAQQSLESALESLQSASAWSMFDMFGGGIISTVIKHGHIDESRNEIHEAQKRLRHFQEELMDIKEVTPTNLEIGGLLTFADYFFDNIIVDWFVHGHIQDSQEQTEKTLHEVNSIISTLQTTYNELEQKISDTVSERISLIESEK